MPNFSAVSNDPAAARLKQTTSPQIWSSFHLGAAVRLVAGVHCPNCATETRACDVELLENGDVRIVCGECHRDLLTIER